MLHLNNELYTGGSREHKLRLSTIAGNMTLLLTTVLTVDRLIKDSWLIIQISDSHSNWCGITPASVTDSTVLYNQCEVSVFSFLLIIKSSTETQNSILSLSLSLSPSLSLSLPLSFSLFSLVLTLF